MKAVRRKNISTFASSVPCLLIFLVFLACGVGACHAQTASITVDPSVRHQVMHGWEAAVTSTVWNDTRYVKAAIPKVLDLVAMTLVSTVCNWESSPGWKTPRIIGSNITRDKSRTPPSEPFATRSSTIMRIPPLSILMVSNLASLTTPLITLSSRGGSACGPREITCISFSTIRITALPNPAIRKILRNMRS